MVGILAWFKVLAVERPAALASGAWLGEILWSLDRCCAGRRRRWSAAPGPARAREPSITPGTRIRDGCSLVAWSRSAFSQAGWRPGSAPWLPARIPRRASPGPGVERDAAGVAGARVCGRRRWRRPPAFSGACRLLVAGLTLLAVPVTQGLRSCGRSRSWCSRSPRPCGCVTRSSSCASSSRSWAGCRS